MKKIRWIIIALTLVICVAVYFNWDNVNKSLLNKDNNSDETSDKILGEESFVFETYFDNARYTRQTTRDEAIAALNTVINNVEADVETKKTASDNINTYAISAEKENIIESLVISKGFTDCVAFVGSDSVSVVVQTTEEGLTTAQASQIIDIVVSETGVNANSVKIIEWKD